MKNTGTIITILTLAGLAIWGITHLAISLYADTAPRMEDARRDVFENTQSYVQGKVQELSKLRREYRVTDDPAEKAALRELILSSASTVDESNLPDDLRSFIEELK